MKVIGTDNKNICKIFKRLSSGAKVASQNNWHIDKNTG